MMGCIQNAAMGWFAEMRLRCNLPFSMIVVLDKWTTQWEDAVDGSEQVCVRNYRANGSLI